MADASLLGFSSDLFTLLKTAAKSLTGWANASAEAKRRFFVEQIEPTRGMLELIDDDYTRSFTVAIENLERNQSLEEVVRILRLERPKKLSKRDDVRVFLESMATAKLEAWKSDAVFDAFYAYVQAVDSYLNAASPLSPGDTWYSAFINTFESLVNDGKDPTAHIYSSIAGQEHTAVKTATGILRTAVFESMPKKWTELTNAYLGLKNECLR